MPDNISSVGDKHKAVLCISEKLRQGDTEFTGLLSSRFSTFITALFDF